MRRYFLVLMILLLGISLFLAASRSATAADFVLDEIVVKYKDNLAPQELALQVASRQTLKKSFLGRIQLFWGDLKLTFARQEKPEIRLSRLQSVDQEVGALDKQKLLETSEAAGKNVYVIKTDGSKSVEQMVNLYEALPEVEYAEPSKILQLYPY